MFGENEQPFYQKQFFCTFLLVVRGTHCKSDDSFSLHTYRRVLFESHSLMQQGLIMIMLPLKCKSFFFLVHCGETNSNASLEVPIYSTTTGNSVLHKEKTSISYGSFTLAESEREFFLDLCCCLI